MEPDKTPLADRQLIAVLRTYADADRLERRLISMGVPFDAVAVDDPRDEAVALRAEMRAELADAVVMPQAAFIATKEGARGFGVVTGGLLAASLLAALPLALIDFGLNYWGRYAVLAGVFVAMAFAGGLVFGPALATRGSEEPAAAERGIIVRVYANSTAIQNAILELRPIRMDEITEDGEPAATLYTENQRADQTVAAAVQDTVARVRFETHNPQ